MQSFALRADARRPADREGSGEVRGALDALALLERAATVLRALRQRATGPAREAPCGSTALAWLAPSGHLALHVCLDSARPQPVLDQAPLAALAAGLDACRPCELLLIDQRLAAALGTAALTRLRQCHPRTRWVWIGPTPVTPRHLDALAAMQAAGALEWTASGTPLVRAMEAMGRGELWLPRHLLQALYESTRHQLQTLSESGFAEWMDEALPAPDNLTQREREVMQQLREGLTNKEIARQLGITVNTVKKHVEHAFAKQGVRRRRQVLGDGEDDPALAAAP